MTDLLDGAQLGAAVESFRHRVFRMETLPAYAVGDDYERWRAGDTDPLSPRKRQWIDQLRRDHAAGKRRQRVRVLSEQLTDYERYSAAWGYALNAEAGEDIRVLRRGEHEIPRGVADRGDFWVVDDTTTITMVYGAAGGFEGAEVEPAQVLDGYLALRDAAWAAAEPFTAWWTRHPELHGSVAV